MADRGRAPADLLDILTRLRLQPPDASGPSAAAQGQLDLLLARIAALTEALRAGAGVGAPEGAPLRTEDERLAARLLLADVGLVVGQLRGEANALAASLNESIRALRAALDEPAGSQ